MVQQRLSCLLALTSLLSALPAAQEPLTPWRDDPLFQRLAAALDPVLAIDNHTHLLRPGKKGSKPDFFGAKPADARFVSASVTPNTDGLSATVVGNLTLNGQTHPVTIAARFKGAGTFPGMKPTVGFQGTATILRSQWGIDAGIPLVSDKVELDISEGADLLIHEATFSDEEHARAVETGHATSREAALVVSQAGVKRLVLTHLSARYSVNAAELLQQAKEVFPETVVARDGFELEVPFAAED